MLLSRSRHAPWHIHQRDDWDVEGVAEADEARALARAVDIEDAGKVRRVVSDYADDAAVHAAEAYGDVARPTVMHLHKVAVVEDRLDHEMNVVGLAGVGRDDACELVAEAVGDIGGLEVRRVLHVVRRDEREQAPNFLQRVLLALDGEVSHTGPGAVDLRAAEFFVSHVLLSDGAYDVGAGDVHLAAALLHEDEVSDSRRVHGPAGARAHHNRNLRHYAGGEDVAREDFAVALKRDDALLDARATAVVDAYQRGAVLHREVHHLADLFASDFRKRSAEDSEVLREDVHETSIDLTEADDDRVAVVFLFV